MTDLTTEECPHTKVYVMDSTMRRNQVPCPWCKDIEIARLQVEHERYKQCLYRANGRLIQLEQEPEKLSYE